MFGDLPSRVKLAYEDLCLKQAAATEYPTTETFEEVSAAWEHWHHISGIEEQFFFRSLGFNGWGWEIEITASITTSAKRETQKILSGES